MLTFIGLGLGVDGISLRGVEKAKNADEVYAELYTSKIPEFDLEDLEKRIGNSIHLLNRKDVEQKPEKIIEKAKEGNVAFLVAGDPMIATTHLDLRLRACEAETETEIVHGPSIHTAAPGLAGLQSYKFGRSATIPLPEKPSDTPYEVLEKNKEMGLHTLFLLDIEAEKERYLNANEALEYLLKSEEKLEKDIFSTDTLSVVVARAGTDAPVVRADEAGKLLKEDFGEPPHVLIVPGELHFMEANALETFGGAPEEALEDNVKG